MLSARLSAVPGLLAMADDVSSDRKGSFRKFLEHLSGAGKAIGVLTSGGDAQGARPPPGPLRRRRSGRRGRMGRKDRGTREERWERETRGEGGAQGRRDGESGSREEGCGEGPRKRNGGRR